MSLNPELVRKLAHGEQEALEIVKTLPANMRVAYGLAVDELKRKENIVPMTNGLEVYEQPKQHVTDPDGVGQAFKKMLDEQKAREAEAERVRKEHEEKVAQDAIARSRAGLRGI